MVWTEEGRRKGRSTLEKKRSDPVWMKHQIDARKETMKNLMSDPDWVDRHNREKYSDNYNIELTEKQEQIILGTLLGDSHIRIPKPRGKTPRLQIWHSINQENYVQYKYNELSNLCASEPKRYLYNVGWSKGKTYSYFHTRALQCLFPIYNTVVINGKKTVTINWIQKMSDCKYSGLALSMWYLDDGFVAQRCYLPTGNKNTAFMAFDLGDRPVSECKLLQEWVEQEFDISSRIHIKSKLCKNGEYNKWLYIHGLRNMIKVKDIVDPYINKIPDMCYKTDLKYKGCQ
jgi:hypothetical protein